MQISNQTIQILKNFAMINPSIAFDPGNELQTIATSKSIMAKAKITESLTTSGAIYDLSRFLGVVSLFEKPEFDFTESQVVVRGGRSSVNYTFADSSMIITPPKDKQINIDNPDVDIDIPGNKIQSVLKAAAVLQLPEVSVMCDGAQLYLQALDSKNPSSDDYKEELELSNETKFNFIFKTENFKMMQFDYNVKLTSRGIAQFTSTSSDMELIYWVAVEANSTYG
jgi:hypothetical protein